MNDYIVQMVHYLYTNFFPSCLLVVSSFVSFRSFCLFQKIHILCIILQIMEIEFYFSLTSSTYLFPPILKLISKRVAHTSSLEFTILRIWSKEKFGIDTVWKSSWSATASVALEEVSRQKNIAILKVRKNSRSRTKTKELSKTRCWNA